jgi:hypothetical protein
MSRAPRILAPFVAALATVVLVSLAAGAHDTDLTDPDDARGLLDIRQVRLAHDGVPPAWTIVTFARWGVLRTWDAGYLIVWIDTQAGSEPEYYALIRSNRYRLEGSLWRARIYGPDSFVKRVEVWRQSGRSASVRVRLVNLAFGPKRTFYRWWVSTIYTSDVCRRTCHDRAPNGTRAVRQWRPGMSPTPSPSESDSATP